VNEIEHLAEGEGANVVLDEPDVRRTDAIAQLVRARDRLRREVDADDLAREAPEAQRVHLEVTLQVEHALAGEVPDAGEDLGIERRHSGQEAGDVVTIFGA